MKAILYVIQRLKQPRLSVHLLYSAVGYFREHRSYDKISLTATFELTNVQINSPRVRISMLC